MKSKKIKNLGTIVYQIYLKSHFPFPIHKTYDYMKNKSLFFEGGGSEDQNIIMKVIDIKAAVISNNQ